MANHWRFKGNGFTTDNGLDTADMETFKKDAFASLAREICQNSIDARRKGYEGPIRVEFKPFSIDRNVIPAIDQIEEEIQACRATWKAKKIASQLQAMSEQIKKRNISCVRISDFGTTGLLGVSTSDDSTPWHYLVHGSGLSDKTFTSGGSKGIGKFATFVTSHFNTVFYSTRTMKDEVGYVGICKLCSAKMPDSEEKTQGIGYFGSSEKNEPILEELHLDPNFSRSERDFGSDIYICGFKTPTTWKSDIISKSLESFMVAIAFGKLEIVVDDVVINADTLRAIIWNEKYINKNLQKSIVSQFLLLTDKENRFEDVITNDLGEARLYLLAFKKDQEDYATNGCVMIRYPYMKIKDINKVSSIPCSAMCIIENNDLNKVLRDIENPQHTDWEFKRIEDETVRQETKAIYSDFLDQIKNIIADHLVSSDETKTDLEGAADYLPQSTEDVGSKDGEKTKILDKPQIQKKKIKPKEVSLHASVEDPNGNGILLDVGDENGEEEILQPSGRNKQDGGDVKPSNEPGQGGSNEDGHIIVKSAQLRGMLYKFFCINKKERKYVVTFISDFDEDDASFVMYALDDSGARDPVEIQSCVINGQACVVESGHMVRLSLLHGKRYKIEMITDQEEMFSGEVRVYAYRK